MEYIGQDRKTGEFLYDTGTQTLRTKIPPDEMEAVQPGWQSHPEAAPAAAPGGPLVERLSPEQLEGSPASQDAYRRYRLERDFGGGRPGITAGDAAREDIGVGGAPYNLNLTPDQISRMGAMDPAQITLDEFRQLEQGQEAGPVAGGGPVDIAGPVPTFPEDEKPKGEAAKTTGTGRGRRVADQFGALREGFKSRLKEEEGKYDRELAGMGGDVDRARVKLGEAEAALNVATEKLKTFEIDPNRAFSNAFSKIGAVIAVALGAYAEGLSRGKLSNTALQIVNDSIKNDIDAQKVEFQKLRGLVDEKRNVYAMGMRLLGNAQEAEHFAKNLAYQAYQGKIQQVGKQMGADIDLLQLEELENYHKGLLYNARVKNSLGRQKIPKMSEKARNAMAGALAVKEQARDVGVASAELGESWGLLTWVNSKLPMVPTDAKSFNRTSQQMTLSIINTLSGLTMTEFEHEKFDRWTPYATDSIKERRDKLTSLFNTMTTRAAGWLRTEPPEVQQLFMAQDPEMGEMMMELNPATRRASVNRYVNDLMSTGYANTEFKTEGSRQVTGL